MTEAALVEAPKRKAKTAVAHVDVPASEGEAMLQLVHRLVSDPATSSERVNQAFDFVQRIEADKAKKEWAASFVAAQAEMEPVRKNAKNTQTNKMYATFDALDSAIRPAYSEHGFAPTYSVEPSEKPEHVKVVLHLLHSAGHERRYEIDIPTDGKGPNGANVMTKTHATGSAFSYGKRYLLGGAFNVNVSHDDDGNAAGSGPTITEDQVIELREIILSKNLSEPNFCKYMKAGKLSEIAASKFEGAKAALVKAEPK